LAALFIAVSSQFARAERFDDIIITPQWLQSGQTYHGYLEFRALVENHSLRATHDVTLIYPDQAWSSGNCINRLSRTARLAPGSRAVVKFWQPPLPAGGNGLLRVEIDGDEAGRVSSATAHGHLSPGRRYGGGSLQSTILVSRNLNHPEVEAAFQGNKSEQFSPSAATGPEDSVGARGVTPTAWSPDNSTAGPHWLELDYDPPVTASQLRICEATTYSGGGGTVKLIGISGTNLLTEAMTSGVRTSSGHRRTSSPRAFTFTQTVEPVKTVRLDFGSTSAYKIGIDAVELTGPSGSAWASEARASSSRSPGSYGSPGHDTRYCLRAELPISEWPDQWLAYSPYDAIALSGDDIALMAPAVADAIWRYVECGGNLFVFGGGELPEPWRAWSSKPIAKGRWFAVGFGQCAVFDNKRVPKMSGPAMDALHASVDKLARYWTSLPQDQSANSAFPVVDKLTLPVRGMVFIMLAFVLTIGPINLVVLSRMKRRTWLLWTIPAISFLTCLIVFAYSLLSEGITPNARIESLTLLDQVNRRATTVGAEAFYCPLTPSQGLRFAYDTEVTPLVETWDYRGYSSGTSREVDWTEGQRLRRGWITARVPAHFALRKSETRRERLQLERTGGQLTVVNGLGAPIRSIRLVDASGRLLTAHTIAAGERAVLSTAAPDLKISGDADLSDLFFRAGYSQHSSALSNNVAGYLRPGTYIAQLQGNPFLENGLGSAAQPKRTRTECFVYGILDSTVGATTDKETPPIRKP